MSHTEISRPTGVPPKLPPLACDTHSHVYGKPGTCPVLDGQHIDPGTTLDDYRVTARRLGVQRTVFVQAKAYGSDPGCMLDAIRQCGTEHARGVIMPDDALSASDLQHMDEAGIRGVRFLYQGDSPIDIAHIADTARRIAPAGWSLLLQASSQALACAIPRLVELPCPIVIDHMGRLPASLDVGSSEFKALLEFVRGGGWIKLAAPYYGTPGGKADFGMLESRVHALLAAGRDRAIWGMNWPHPNFAPGGKPDDLSSLVSLLRILPSPADRHRLFVANPARLYGFDAP